MNDDNKRLSTGNLIDTENRVTVLEGETPKKHSGTLKKTELVELGDKITVLEGEKPKDRELRISELLYLDDRVTVLEKKEHTTFTITYDLNKGTGDIDPIKVTKGESIQLNDGSAITAPKDKTFAGWSTTKDDDSTKVESPYTPKADITLYALYA